MRLTPIEIRQHRFNTRLRGFDPDEVNVFLEAVVTDFEEVVRENAKLRREAERLASELESFRGRERTIQETLTTAQTVVDQLKRTAVKESEVLVTGAELRAEQLLRHAEKARGALQHEVLQLRQLRARVDLDLRRTLEGYLKIVDSFRDASEAADDLVEDAEPLDD
jgi:cell division initiation protein